MTHQDLKKQMLLMIILRTQKGVGARTTEVEDLWRQASGLKKPSCGYNDGSEEAKNYYDKFPKPRTLPADLVRELKADGKIRYLNAGGYCWLVPVGSEHYIGIKGTFVDEPFDLW